MYVKLSNSGDDTLGFRIEERLTEDQLSEVLTEIEGVIAEHGSANLLVHMPSVPHPDLDALDEDLGFWLQHRDDLDRYAVVGDSTLLEWATEFGDHVTGVDCRYFDEADLDDAWAWARGEE
jgi:hypothetical protein